MINKAAQAQARTTNGLLQAIKEENNLKTTENGAVALKSTFSPLLDLFGQIGELRSRTESEILNLFSKAYAVDRLSAIKTLFYARDVRGGLGERNTFRIILRDLAFSHPADVLVNLSLIPEYGRWDDLFVLMGTPLEKATLALISEQFSKDMDTLSTKSTNSTAPISLLAKWMPSENASSAKTKKLATTLRVHLGLTSKEYRKALTALRAAIQIVESKMSAREWEDINYSSVPSIASLRYRAAFTRHDMERYTKFLEQVSTGEKKINASTLYPYDLVRNYIGGSDSTINPTIEAQWKALPDYITKDQDFLIMADVSGSMYSNRNTPISTSVGLAIYFAERSKGAFANHFITFTDIPELVEIPKNLSLREKVRTVLRTEGFDTNLEAAFELVLKSAIKNNVAPKDMPTAIVIISDMEINEFGNCRYEDDGSSNITFTEEMSRRFADAGYIMPTLVYWNVDAREDTFHAIESDNVRFVSGSSPSVFKGLCENLGYSAYELMMAVINASRYDAIKISK